MNWELAIGNEFSNMFSKTFFSLIAFFFSTEILGDFSLAKNTKRAVESGLVQLASHCTLGFMSGFDRIYE